MHSARMCNRGQQEHHFLRMIFPEALRCSPKYFAQGRSVRAKHLAALAVPFVFFIAAPPVVAQQQGAPSTPAAPYYGSMTWGWSGRPGWDLHPFMMVVPIVSIFGLLILVGIMLIFMWLVRWGTHFHPFHGRGGASHDILEERFARGEIDKAEFEDKGRLLSR
jgi:putative membrane protein